MTEITLPYLEFERAIRLVAQHAGDDKMTPALNWINFQSHGPHMLAWATDRYTLGAVRLGLAIDAPEFALAAKECLRVLAVLKPTRRSAPNLRITLSATEAEFALADGLPYLGTRLTMAIERRPIEAGIQNGCMTLLRKVAAESGPVEGGLLPTRYLRRLPVGFEAATVVHNGQAHGFFGSDWAVLVMAQRGDSHVSAWATAAAAAGESDRVGGPR